MWRCSKSMGFVLALALLGCGCVGDPNDPHTWIKKLHDIREQREAVRNLVRINDKVAVQPLMDLYKDPKGSRDPEVLDAIIHFHDARAIPLLIEALDYTEQDFDAATKAAAELGNLKAKESIPALLKALDKPLPIKSRANLAKQEAIRALAKIKDPASVDALCKVVKALPDEQDMFLNKVAALALGQIGDPRGVPCLLNGAFIARADNATFFPEVRIAVTKIGEPSVDPLIQLLQEKNAEVNEMAKKLDFKPGVIGFKAAYLLGDLRAKKAVPALIARLKEPPKGDMQRSILVSLGQIGEPAGVDAALAVLKDSRQKQEYREGACQAMMAARNVGAVPTLLALAKDKKTAANLRVAAAYALGVLGGKSEYDSFASTVKSEEYIEVKQALERLEVAKSCTGDLDDCYIKALDDPKVTRQEKGALMLGTSKNKQKALGALLAHMGVQEQVVRLAIIDSVRRLADKGCTACQTKLQEQISKEEKLVTKIPQFKGLVDEMSVTLAALTKA